MSSRDESVVLGNICLNHRPQMMQRDISFGEIIRVKKDNVLPRTIVHTVSTKKVNYLTMFSRNQKQTNR
jgi:hypothetical protein